jgi:hypothetical protein
MSDLKLHQRAPPRIRVTSWRVPAHTDPCLDALRQAGDDRPNSPPHFVVVFDD